MSIIEQDLKVLNFVVVGDVRSGSSVVQSSICNRGSVVICHADLLHDEQDQEKATAVRRAAHEAYFGASKDPERLPEWFVAGETVPAQYINHMVLDNPRNGESAVGLRVLYPTVQKWELHELFEARCREGDFCLIHVERNPVACFVSLKQAERTGVWSRGWNDRRQAIAPMPVTVDAGELTDFCRVHSATKGKIRAACTDALTVAYRSLLLDYQGTMRTIFDFLELSPSDEPAMPSSRRLKNRDIQGRVSNFAKLRSEVPSDVKSLMDGEDLY